jgi:hypothetical protein
MSFRDPRPDPAIARALRRVGADELHAARELGALRRRIVEHAEPLLRRRRPQGTWWEYALAWHRTLVPLALAAAAAATFGIVHLPARGMARDLAAASASGKTVLLEAVANRVSSGDLLDALVSGDGAEGAHGVGGETTSKGSTQ